MFHNQSIEQSLRTATVPISSNEIEEISALGYRGVFLNRNEILSWKGPVPIQNYRLNDDSHPEVISKTNAQPVEYNQEIQVRYLRPPTPLPAGDIIIREQPATVHQPAPPLILRQHAPEPATPETLVFREPPPQQPAVAPAKVITIPGKVIDPPPRKVIIEKLAPLPPKPAPVVIEKWLPFKEPARRVIFEPAPAAPQHEAIRNLIIQWQQQHVDIKRKISYLGITRTDPQDYLVKYGHHLRHTHEYSGLVLESPPVEAVGQQLVGNLEALRHLDSATLEREGLGQYKHLISDFVRQSPASFGHQASVNSYNY